MSENAPSPTRTETRDDEDDPSRSRADLGHAEPELGPRIAAEEGADDPDRKGEIIGRFRVLSRLGEGGMGVVYAAEDTRLGRTVALKILSREAVHREDRRLRFLREARAASAVMHPSIAAIFEVGEHGDEVFLAMERVPGETLRSALRKRAEPMKVADALRIARDIAAGLKVAHTADIVHRDLKPENVMITPDGHVKILDFGLAKRVTSERSLTPQSSPTADLATREGQILGTAGYMSPEQALGEEVDPRADLFALGVILFELLTQTRPFDGETRVAVMMATYRDPAPPPSSRNPAVNSALDAVVLKCLEKRPQDRYSTAAALIEALSDPALTSTAPLTDAQTGDLAAPDRPRGRTALLDRTARRQGLSTSTWLLGAAGIAAIAGVAVVGQRFSETADGRAGSAAPTGTLAASSPSGAAAPTGTLDPSGGPGALASTGTLPPSATGTLSAPESSASSGAAEPQSTPRRPCLKGDPGKTTACEGRPAIPWCDAEGRAIGCCGKGLVPKGADGICVCPPGGTAVQEALSRGCEPVSPGWEAAFMKAKREAMERSIACFQPESHPKSISGGTFEASFFLTPEGDVFDARVKLSTMPDDRGQSCAVAAVRAVHFPPPPGEEAGEPLGFGFVFNK